MNVIETSFADGRFEKDRRGWYYNFFHIIKKNSSIFHLMLHAHLLNNSVFFTHKIMEKLDPKEDTVEHYNFLAWQGALSSIAIHWFKNGMKESIDFMADYCASSLLFSSIQLNDDSAISANRSE